MLKIPTGGRQTSWKFTKHGLGFENRAAVKQIQVVIAGLEPEASRLQVQRPNHLAMPPPIRTKGTVLLGLQRRPIERRVLQWNLPTAKLELVYAVCYGNVTS